MERKSFYWNWPRFEKLNIAAECWFLLTLPSNLWNLIYSSLFYIYQDASKNVDPVHDIWNFNTSSKR